MHPKIKAALDQDLKVIQEELNKQRVNEDKYKDILFYISQRFTDLPDEDFRTYSQVIDKIKTIIKIDSDLAKTIYDIEAWLVGNNCGYDEILSDFKEDSNITGEVYDYLIKMSGH